MLIRYLLNVRREFVVVTLDIKDAFPRAAQPTTENAFAQVDDRIFKLPRCLPGQRTGALQWFQLSATTHREYGLEQDLVQPALMFTQNLLYLIVRVGDVFIAGREDKVRDLVRCSRRRSSGQREDGFKFAVGSQLGKHEMMQIYCSNLVRGTSSSTSKDNSTWA